MQRVRPVLLAVSVALFVAVPAIADHRVLKGEAIYYSDEYAGSPNACGGVYRPRKMIAAHRELPCGTVLRVKNKANGASAVVTVRDRGPFGDKGTILDVSRRAARKLGFITAGRTEVRAVVLHDR